MWGGISNPTYESGRVLIITGYFLLEKQTFRGYWYTKIFFQALVLAEKGYVMDILTVLMDVMNKIV